MLIKGIFVNQNQLRAWLQNAASTPAKYKEKILKAKGYNNSLIEFAMLFRAPKMKVFQKALH